MQITGLETKGKLQKLMKESFRINNAVEEYRESFWMRLITKRGM